MTDYNPAFAHWWAPEGTGEITRHWFRPVCAPDAERRKIPEREQYATPQPGKVVCADCKTIQNAMVERAMANHPAGKGRAS
jgi:hypothetical protein